MQCTVVISYPRMFSLPHLKPLYRMVDREANADCQHRASGARLLVLLPVECSTVTRQRFWPFSERTRFLADELVEQLDALPFVRELGLDTADEGSRLELAIGDAVTWTVGNECFVAIAADQA